MSKNKKLYITIIIVIITLSWLAYISLDFSRFIFDKKDIQYFKFLPFKKIVLILAVILVWSIGDDGLNKKDTGRLKHIYVLLYIADFALGIGQDIAGIGLFGVCQILLIRRNGSGLGKLVSNKEISKHKKTLITYGIVILSIFIGLIRFLFYPILEGKLLFYAIMLYGILLSISLFTAILNYITGIFPKKNSSMVVLGMTCFFFADFATSLVIVLRSGFYWRIATCLEWALFGPAIVIIALSGYKNISK
jgi:hypothetical protein